MWKYKLKPNGWFPFLPMVLPFAAFMVIGASIIDSEPLADAWLRHLAVGVLTAISGWAVASKMERARLRRQK